MINKAYPKNILYALTQKERTKIHTKNTFSIPFSMSQIHIKIGLQAILARIFLKNKKGYSSNARLNACVCFMNAHVSFH